MIWTGNNTMGCPTGMTIKNKNLLFFDEEINWLMDVDYYKRMFDLHGERGAIDFSSRPHNKRPALEMCVP